MKIIEENQKSKDQLIKNKQMKLKSNVCKVEYVNDELDGIINHLKKERGENKRGKSLRERGGAKQPLL